MATLKIIIKKNSCKSEPLLLKPTSNLRIEGFESKLRELSIIAEDQGTRLIYYATSTSAGFLKKDPLEFRKVWLEYNKSDRDYEVELAV